jgi:hypothetical protein
LDPGRLSAFANMDVVEVELAKEAHQFRSYSDPFLDGWHQGGRPSAVHVYATTLRELALTGTHQLGLPCTGLPAIYPPCAPRVW